MKKLLLTLVLLVIPNQASSDDVCFADAYGVRRHSPDAWPSWTYQMPGHKGERCYFPTTKEKRHSRIAQKVEHLTLTQGVGSSNLSAAAIPLPKPRLGSPDDVIDRIAAEVADNVLAIRKIEADLQTTEWIRSLFKI